MTAVGSDTLLQVMRISSLEEGGRELGRFGYRVSSVACSSSRRELLLMTSAKFPDFLTASSPYLHSELICCIKFMQPPLLRLLFHDPSPLRCGHHIWPPSGKAQLFLFFSYPHSLVFALVKSSRDPIKITTFQQLLNCRRYIWSLSLLIQPGEEFK